MKKMYKQPQTETTAFDTDRLMGTMTESIKESGPGVIEAPSVRVVPPAAPAPLQ